MDVAEERFAAGDYHTAADLFATQIGKIETLARRRGDSSPLIAALFAARKRLVESYLAIPDSKDRPDRREIVTQIRLMLSCVERAGDDAELQVAILLRAAAFFITLGDVPSARLQLQRANMLFDAHLARQMPQLPINHPIFQLAHERGMIEERLGIPRTAIVATNAPLPRTITRNHIDLGTLALAIDPSTVAQAVEAFERKDVRVRSCADGQATVDVADRTASRPQRVTVVSSDLGLQYACSCRLPPRSCFHCYAAALGLWHHLTPSETTIPAWRTTLSYMNMRAGAEPVTVREQDTVILFSLVLRDKDQWYVLPLEVSRPVLGQEAPLDRDAVAAALLNRQILDRAKPITTPISTATHPSASVDEVAAVNLIMFARAQPQQRNAYEPVLQHLVNCHAFLGDKSDPFRARLQVYAEPAELTVALSKQPNGLALRTQVHIGERFVPVQPRLTVQLVAHPLWLLVGATLVRIPRAERQALALIKQPELLIPADDVELFYNQYLVDLSTHVPVHGNGVQWEEISGAPELRLYISDPGSEGLQLRIELRYAYGPIELRLVDAHEQQERYRVPQTARFVRVRRDTRRETEALEILRNHEGLALGDENGVFLLAREASPLHFLFEHLPALVEQGFVAYGEEKLVAYKINRHQPKVTIVGTGDTDWFDMTVSFGDTIVSLKEVQQALRRGTRFVKLSDSALAQLPEHWAARYKQLLDLGRPLDDGMMRFSKTQVSLIAEVVGEDETATVDTSFQSQLAVLTSAGPPHDVPLPAHLNGELRPYQKDSYDWLRFLEIHRLGGCLALDQGLGKTVVAIALLESVYDRDPDAPASLIAMPRSLLFNWQREIARFAPKLDVYVHADGDRTGTADRFEHHHVVLTTYGTVVRDVAMLEAYEFHHVILDESQAIKNAQSATARAVKHLRARHRLTLTGTPLENTTLELWSQMDFLNPGMLGSLEAFRRSFVTPIERRQDTEAAERLRALAAPFILRRTKAQVATDLPPRTEQLLVCDMEPAQRKLYRTLRDSYRAELLGLIDDVGMDKARMQIFDALLRLRQVANHPRLYDREYSGGSGKFDVLTSTLETLQAEGHRALVFSQFVQMLSIVRDHLNAAGVPYSYLDGQTRDRQGEVDRFQGGNAPFFLISLKAGGVGLNLTAADYVIHIDPWWNPAVEQQATDRAHRIGQTRPVMVYKLVTQESVEEKILDLQERKRNLVASIIESEGESIRSMTRHDVESLFS